MCSGTVSKIDVILEINGNERIRCQLKRHLSPITVGLITRMLPLKGNIHQMGRSIIYFETGINSGIERKRTICFYMDDISSGKPMTIVGKIIDGIDKLSGTKSSDILSLSRN